jgi:flagellar basal body-associated protein FliL
MAVESVKAAFNAVVKPGFQITAVMIIIGILVLAAIGGGAWYFTSGPGHKTAPANQPSIQTTQVIR